MGYWMNGIFNDWMKLYEWMNDCSVTVYQISMYRETGIIKLETKIYHWYCFAAKFMLDTNFELKSHKTVDFMKIVLAVCRLDRYREK